MYSGHGRLCVCLSIAAFPHYCMDPDVSWGNSRGCHVVAYYLADLYLVHGFRCYDSIVPTAKCQPVLILALCLVLYFIVLLLLSLHVLCCKFIMFLKICSAVWQNKSSLLALTGPHFSVATSSE